VTTSEKQKPEGVLSAGGILDRIVTAKMARLQKTKQEKPLAQLIRETESLSPDTRSSFFDSLNRTDRINIIAEIKRRSPSKGILRENFNPLMIAESYKRAGTAAISILTEEDFFDGSLGFLSSVHAEVSTPLLRKDFIFDQYQVYEAAATGASALLLIVAILDDQLLRTLLELTNRIGIDALVEVHTEEEMMRAIDAGAKIIGVNNRDLTNFNVELETSVRLAPLAPGGTLLVSESGINTRSDIEMLRSAGFAAFLIGERFMRADDPGEALSAMVSK
jgi:indole-3-glycerol phosphate synthase